MGIRDWRLGIGNWVGSFNLRYLYRKVPAMTNRLCPALTTDYLLPALSRKPNSKLLITNSVHIIVYQATTTHSLLQYIASALFHPPRS